MLAKALADTIPHAVYEEVRIGHYRIGHYMAVQTPDLIFEGLDAFLGTIDD